MVTFNQVLSFVQTKKLTADQRKEIWDALRDSQRQQAFERVANFKRGDRVHFRHRGIQLHGRVTGLNTLTVAVKLDNGQQWRIGPSHLKKIAI